MSRPGYFEVGGGAAVTTEFLDRLSDAAHSGVLSEQLSDDLRAAVWCLMHLMPDKR